MSRPRFDWQRYRLWQREAMNNYLAGGPYVAACNLCGGLVPFKCDWHESHRVPKCFGGKRTGVAHAACNLKDGVENVAPAFRKSNRVRAKHAGELGPGRGRYPMPAGRLSRWSKKMDGGLQPRLTQGQKLDHTRALRAIVPATDVPLATGGEL